MTMPPAPDSPRQPNLPSQLLVAAVTAFRALVATIQGMGDPNDRLNQVVSRSSSGSSSHSRLTDPTSRLQVRYSSPGLHSKPAASHNLVHEGEARVAEVLGALAVEVVLAPVVSRAWFWAWCEFLYTVAWWWWCVFDGCEWSSERTWRRNC